MAKQAKGREYDQRICVAIPSKLRKRIERALKKNSESSISVLVREGLEIVLDRAGT